MLSFYDNWNLSFLLLSLGRGPDSPEEEEGKVSAEREVKDEAIKIEMSVCPAGRNRGAEATLTSVGVGVGVGAKSVGGELAVKRVTARTAEEDRRLWIEAKIQSQLLPRSHITQIIGHKKQGKSANHFFASSR